jgi:selenocysteine lyase/cysteine desulfurase
MKAIVQNGYGGLDVLALKEVEPTPYPPFEMVEVPKVAQLTSADDGTPPAFAELQRGVVAALETYSNVHRGSGHNSVVSTRLYEEARDIVLEYLGLNKARFAVIFCTPRRAAALEAQLAPERVRIVASEDFGLPLGVRAVAVERSALPRGIPAQTGGGTARLVAPGWVIWAREPDRFEAGTPAIVNVIAFARALRLIQRFGNDAFLAPPLEMTAGAGKLAAAEILYRDELERFSGCELLDQLRKTLIGRSVRVPTADGARPYINLDNGASTPTFTPIWDAVCQAWRQPGRAQQEIVREVRSICAEVLGAPLADYDVVFTSNTTEAINLAAESLRNASEQGVETVVLNTLLEHNSNELPWRMDPRVALLRLPVDDEGFIDLRELETLLCAYNQKCEHGKQRIRLVAVSGASNVLGVYNDLAEISRIVHSHGAQLLVDAAQLVAHRKVEMERWGIDYLAFSGHKVYAPFGSGALVVRKGLLSFDPAELDLIHSSGEENVGGIAALGKALVLLRRIGLDVVQEEEQALTARALRGLAQIPDLTMYGIKEPDSPRFAQKGGVIVFSLKGIVPSRVARELAERGGIGVRSGCHCAHLTVKRMLKIPPLLEQLQGVILTFFRKLELPGVVRVSLGIENRPDDVDTLIHVLGEIARKSRAGVDKDVQRQMDDFAQFAARRVYGLGPAQTLV